MSALRRLGLRLIGIAEDPADDDGVRLRKRIGVAAGYITILAPATLPIHVDAWNQSCGPATRQLDRWRARWRW